MIKKCLNLRQPSVEARSHGSWNKTVAANRGDTWRSNILKGRINVALHPSKIRTLRMQRFMHQTTVANKLGLTSATYGDIERGLQQVKRDRAILIAKFYGKTVNDLFKPSGKKFIAITS